MYKIKYIKYHKILLIILRKNGVQQAPTCTLACTVSTRAFQHLCIAGSILFKGSQLQGQLIGIKIKQMPAETGLKWGLALGNTGCRDRQAWNKQKLSKRKKKGGCKLL